MQFQKVTVVGVGLLGGSLGLALKQRRLAGQVVGVVRREASLAECERLEVLDQATRDPRRAAADADLIVLCTPISRMAGIIGQMLPALKRGVVVTDVGSVKEPVVEELEPMVCSGQGHFVGSHPMAGAERTGPRAARADLFCGAICVVTPSRRSSSIAVKRVEDLWRAVGGIPLRLSPRVHDDLVSRSSHLPHVVAVALANYILSPIHPRKQAALCANGFRDATRIASGSPEMWKDILVANRRNVARVLGVFIDDLEELRHAIETGDDQTITESLETAKQRRDAWASHHQPTSAESTE